MSADDWMSAAGRASGERAKKMNPVVLKARRLHDSKVRTIVLLSVALVGWLGAGLYEGASLGVVVVPSAVLAACLAYKLR